MEVVWSPMALEHLLKVLGYVEDEYGALVAQKTRQKIQEKVNLLVKYPQMGLFDSDFSILLNGLEVRHLKLSPNALYYLIDENRVVIAAIVHSKQSPETIREIISEFFKQYK